MYTCEFCKNEYKTISSLNNHKKTAKKCLILREQEGDFFECKTCDFKTTLKNSLNIHKCKFKHINEINECKNIISALELELKLKIDNINTIKIKNKELELKIKEDKKDLELLIKQNTELKEKLEKHENHLFILSSKPTNTSIKIENLNNVLSSIDFKDNTFKEQIDNHFTAEHLIDGIKGVADFTKKYIINPGEDGKQKYLCADPARAIFRYKDENGVIQKDVKASKLKNAIKDPIINKSKTLIQHETTRQREEGEEKFDISSNKLVDKFFKILNIDDNINDYAREMILIC